MPLPKSGQMIFIVLVGISILKAASTEIVVAPKDAEAVVGANVVFQCSSSIPGADVQWNVYPVGKSMQVIYAYGKFNTPYADRFTVQNGHNLNISSINIDDAGTYECRDGYGKGEKQSAELIILESNPTCRSSSDLKKVVGKNTCGIEPSEVTLSCSVQYQGNKAPTLQWVKNGDDKPITSGVSNENRGNRFLHNLTMKGDTITNGSSYNCRPAKATSATAKCNSGTITILATSDSCQSSNAAAIVCIIIIVIPIFNAITAAAIWYLFIHKPKQEKHAKDKQSRTYSIADQGAVDESSIPLKQQPLDNNGQPGQTGESTDKTKSSDLKQKQNKGGQKCQCSKDAIIFVSLMAIPFCIGLGIWYLIAYRRLREKIKTESVSAAVDNQPVCTPSEEKEYPEHLVVKNDDKTLIPEAAGHQAEDSNVEPLKEIIEKLQEENKHLRTKVKDLERFLNPPEIIEYVEKPSLVQKIKLVAPTKESKLIIGLAMLGNELFILHEKSSEIQVYDSVTYQLQRKLQNSIIGEPFDLTTGKADRCLFIIGLARESDATKQSASKEKNKTTAKEPDIDKKTLHESLIGRFNVNGELLNPWPKPSGGHKGHLSTYESNLIVCILEKNVITEFSKKGDLLLVVKLSPAADFRNPWHAIKLSSWHFVVSHKCDKSEHHRICVVNLEGKIVKECREFEKGKFKASLPFTVDSGGSFLVADTDNHNILLLDSALQCQKKLIEFKERPARICFDKTQKFLFVAENKKNGGVVKIYDVKK